MPPVQLTFPLQRQASRNIAGKLVAVKMAEIENHKAGDLSTAPRELLGTQSESVLAVMEQLRKFKVPRGT
ncbi:hypothetical protein WJX72_007442 [[Myrmecia] bisecta]|uniref:Uncharacterized protein n=1 Tax=[Myrmecia] bisecta TaxID=41462 RepID=A0AAW1PPQ6_9CHLO